MPLRQSKFVSFRIPDDMYAALDRLKIRDGIPLSEQMRRALLLWLEQKGLALVAAPKKGRR